MNTNTKQSAITATLVKNAEGRIGGLQLEFSNGRTLALIASQLSRDIMEMAIWHGVKSKLVDAAAISRNPDTGASATVEDKYNAVREVYDRITDPTNPMWNKVREGGAGAVGGLLLRALVRMYDGRKTVEQLREYLDGKTPAEKAALRKNPKVAAIIDEIRAERADDDGIDTDELLSELED